jgi:hypothetical protein
MQKSPQEAKSCLVRQEIPRILSKRMFIDALNVAHTNPYDKPDE